MSSVGSVNIINGGLDVQGIVDNLISVAHQPIDRLQTQTQSYQTKISAYQALNSNILALQTSVEKILYSDGDVPLSTPADFASRFDSSIFAARTATSTNEDAVTASAGNGMATGSYTVSVSQRATYHTLASNNFSSDTTQATKTGTLVIQKGTDPAVTITIDSSNNSLQGIKNAINNANAGFTASIINDGSSSPYRLMITSDDSGTANALTITNNLTAGTGTQPTFAQQTAAQNALLTVNNINITSSSNTVTNAIEGVTLNINADSGTSVVSVGRDLDTIVSGIQDFVTKYNAFNSYISSQSTYNTTTKTAGLLAGDPTIRDAQNQVATALTQSISSNGGAFSVLSQAGIKMANDGSLSVDETQLRDALSTNFSDTARLFLADGTEAGGNSASLLPNLETRLKTFTDTIDGPIFHATDALQQNINRINDEIKQMESRLEVQRELLITQYTQADQALRQLNVLQTSITSQLSSLTSA